MTADIAIKNANVVTSAGTFRGGVAVHDGIIAAVGLDAELPSAARTIDARGRYLIPGLVDPHMHLLAPPGDDWAGILRSETRACAAGGVTTVVHCLMEHRGGSAVEALERVLSAYEGNGFVDMACSSAVLTMENIKEMQSALERGIGAFKFFMAYRGPEASPGMPAADDGVIFLGFEEIARLVKEGYKTCARVHAETVEILFRLEERYREKGVVPKTYTELRPPFLEVEAIQKCILWGRETGCPIYIVHVSTEEGARLIADARAAGMDVTAETCPQYLVLNTDNTDLVLSKTNPPVRTVADNAALWRALSAGSITCVGTDHVATHRAEKADFWTALGIPGVATWLPLMLTEGVAKKRLTIEQVIDSCCLQPAKKFGLAPRKGVITAGSDADLVLLDTSTWRTVNPGNSFGRSDFSCYDGWELTGWPVLTMVRGKVVYEAGQVLGEAVGRFVPAAVR